MQIRELGKTGIRVTELCFGVLPMGPIQKNIPMEEGAGLIRMGVEAGINFLDSAEMYRTHEYIRHALRGWDKPVVIATKSASTTYEAMKASVEKARQELDRDVIDIFHIHAARADKAVFTERAGAIECLVDYKAKGLIKAVGISTHAVDVVDAAPDHPEIDVVFPIINKRGMGILNGNVADMLAAIEKVHQAGQGLYAMKALAGGHLIGEITDAIQFVRDIPGMSSTAIGMVEPKELALNLRIFNDEVIDPAELPKSQIDKRLIVLSYCVGCGKCTTICPNHALSVQGGKATVDHSKCLLCGYCSPECPLFALRLV